MILDKSNIRNLMEYGESVNQIISRVTTAIVEHGSYECDLIGSLTMELKILEEKVKEIKPYVNESYNPNYGDNRLCKCGHTYERHFDSYDNMYPVGCKYCGCTKFEEMRWADLSNEAKNVLEWSENVINDNHDIMEISVNNYFDRPAIGRDGKTHILVTAELFNEIVSWCMCHKEYIVIERRADYFKFVLRYNGVFEKLKEGDRVEFIQKGMKPVLHGKIVTVDESCVKVKCKNGCYRFPNRDDIIRIM